MIEHKKDNYIGTLSFNLNQTEKGHIQLTHIGKYQTQSHR